MAITTYGDVNQRTAAYAYAEFLSHAQPVIVLQRFGLTKPVPRNKSRTVKFRRTVTFPANTTPLQEGVAPTPRNIQFEDVEVMLRQYGDYVVITDVVEDLAEDPVREEATKQCAEQAARTWEQLTYMTVRGGTSVVYANGTARSQVNTPISLNRQRLVTRTLQRNQARRFTSVLDGSVRVSTKPVEAAYIAVGHTDIEADVRNLTGFVPTAQYGTRTLVSEHEIGSVESVRYVTSPHLNPFQDAGGPAGSTVVSTSGTNADVYPIMYFGQEAFGCVPLRGMESAQIMVVNPSKPDSGNPLGQTGSVGWKGYFACVILNQSWMSRLEAAVSRL